VWSPQGIYGVILRKTGFSLFPLQRKIRFVESSHATPEAEKAVV
jgi:hypothetical protein